MSIFWRKEMRSLLFSLWLFSSTAMATSFHSLDDIHHSVHNALLRYVGESESGQYHFDIQTLDTRLRLSQCSDALAVSVPQTLHLAGRKSVEVRCPGIKPWKIYLQVTVNTETEIPVFNKVMQAGQRISAQDISYRTINLGQNSRPIIRDPNQLIGMLLKRHSNANIPISASAIEIPKLVERGQQVTLEYDLNGIVVRMAGRANEDGAEGDWIKIVNLSSGKTIEGRVSAMGNVVIRN